MSDIELTSRPVKAKQFHPTRCEHCGGEIAVGDPCHYRVYLAGGKRDGKVSSGWMHRECYARFQEQQA